MRRLGCNRSRKDKTIKAIHNDCIALSNLLLRKDGSVRPWHEYKREAMKIVGRSNRYLKTEYNTARITARMASKWQEVQEKKHVFPYVKFYVTLDPHTSEICQPLHGLVVRVDDPFLQHYFPPNHFNCRTHVVQLREAEPTPQKLLPYFPIPKAFLNNAGATGEIFTEENSYIANTPKLLTRDLEYTNLGGVEVSTLAKKYTTSENEMPRVEREYQNRLIVAKALKNYLDAKVRVLPEILPNHWAYDYHFEGVPNYGKVPDLKIGEDFWEMESYEKKFKIGKISQMIKHGQEQSDFVVIKLNHYVDTERILKQLEKLKDKNDFPFTAKRILFVSKDEKIIIDYQIKKPLQ